MKNFAFALVITAFANGFASNVKAEAAVFEHCHALQERDKPESYLDLYALAVEYAIQTCQNLLTGFEAANYSTNYVLRGADDRALMAEFARVIKQNFPESHFPNANAFAESWLLTPNAKPLNPAHFKDFRLDSGPVPGTFPPALRHYAVGRYGMTQLEFADNNQSQQAHCQKVASKSCYEVAIDINAAFFIYGHYIAKYSDDQVKKTLQTTLAQWDVYETQAPQLNLWSIGLTTWVHKDHFYGKSWPGPPPYQVRTLEWSLILDHMPSVEDGAKTKPGLALEWIGFNDWDNKTLPWGAGLASVYVDRAGVKKLGYGLIVNLNNNEYSFGVVRRGGENSFFINLNLSQWLADNENKISRYKTNIKEEVNKILP